MKVLKFLVIALLIVAVLNMVMLMTWPKELIMAGFCLVIAYLMMRKI